MHRFLVLVWCGSCGSGRYVAFYVIFHSKMTFSKYKEIIRRSSKFWFWYNWFIVLGIWIQIIENTTKYFLQKTGGEFKKLHFRFFVELNWTMFRVVVSTSRRSHLRFALVRDPEILALISSSTENIFKKSLFLIF